MTARFHFRKNANDSSLVLTIEANRHIRGMKTIAPTGELRIRYGKHFPVKAKKTARCGRLCKWGSTHFAVFVARIAKMESVDRITF
jgi:hypothetical protein